MNNLLDKVSFNNIPFLVEHYLNYEKYFLLEHNKDCWNDNCCTNPSIFENSIIFEHKVFMLTECQFCYIEQILNV